MSASPQSLPAPNAKAGATLERLAHLVRNRFVLGGLGLLLAGAIFAAVISSHARAVTSYVTAPVERQTLVQSVSASGTVNPQNTVSVGTQVSGTISEIDVDFNSKVRKGQVLARLDPSTLQAQLNQAQASLAQAQDQASVQADTALSAQAGISSAGATLTRMRSALALAQNVLQRDQNLLAQGYVARAQVQTDQDAVAAAQAALETAQSQVLQAASSAAGGGASASAAQEAIAAQAAVVQEDQLNLQRSVITSPVNGTVVAREVSVGQTVAASLQTPTLFTIAQDLTKMEIDIAVGEPDIGSVRPGENVSFTVLAYPNDVFHGIVTQVRVSPTTVNNVVTYTVITKVSNPGGKLLPGMTATATIAVASAPNALVVPLQAVHAHTAGTGQASPWGQTAQGSSAQTVAAGSIATVVVERGGQVAPVRVRVVLVSGTQAAVTPLQGTLALGDAVVISSTGAQRSTRPASSGSAFGAMRALH
ncbi:MAG: efflux RND transporter periplasmic adaptor subunit [Candidatus Tyrphobacter sp.]